MAECASHAIVPSWIAVLRQVSIPRPLRQSGTPSCAHYSHTNGPGSFYQTRVDKQQEAPSHSRKSLILVVYCCEGEKKSFRMLNCPWRTRECLEITLKPNNRSARYYEPGGSKQWPCTRGRKCGFCTRRTGAIAVRMSAGDPIPAR